MSKQITATYEVAMAAGRDAGNASMKRAGRTSWAQADYAAAARTVAKLLGTS